MEGLLSTFIFTPAWLQEMNVLCTMCPQMVIYSLTHQGAYFHLWTCSSEAGLYSIIGDNFLTSILVLKLLKVFLLMHKYLIFFKLMLSSNIELASLFIAVLWCDGLGGGKRQKRACLTSTLRLPSHINTHRKHATTSSLSVSCTYIHIEPSLDVLRSHTHCLNFKVPSPASFLWHGACYTFYCDI